MTILVTGGAGYIGSHTCVELLNAGYEVIVVDNLSNSKIESLNHVRKITGKDIEFHEVDILCSKGLERLFFNREIHGVMHFAGYKASSESVKLPLSYYYNNITGTLILCNVMKKYGVKRMVFSSSATVYGNPHSVPISEDFPLNPINPYGRTKEMIERILQDLYISDNEWSIGILRYFNPVGAHPSGMTGEDPKGIPNNLMPYITKVAVGELKSLQIFGNDYFTRDGTGIRDYIHVVDLADGHLKTIEELMKTTGVHIYNLGTGNGYSVLELVRAFEEFTGVSIPYTIVERRPGDIAECYADPSKANRELNWFATRGLKEMCIDSWNWQYNNPKGYYFTK